MKKFIRINPGKSAGNFTGKTGGQLRTLCERAGDEFFDGEGTVVLRPDLMEDLRGVPELKGREFRFSAKFTGHYGDTLNDVIYTKVRILKDIDNMGGVLIRGGSDEALEWFLNGGVEDAVRNGWYGVEWLDEDDD